MILHFGVIPRSLSKQIQYMQGHENKYNILFLVRAQMYFRVHILLKTVFLFKSDDW